ncbi:hypothetical protein M0804_014407 [Polistes exclamans]|nr:hypothetical protein M0804_014412 [Polistes exclamans]KAI4475274.1 hypothetical protein M0804_014407 [Polistes exclamans]
MRSVCLVLVLVLSSKEGTRKKRSQRERFNLADHANSSRTTRHTLLAIAYQDKARTIYAVGIKYENSDLSKCLDYPEARKSMGLVVDDNKGTPESLTGPDLLWEIFFNGHYDNEPLPAPLVVE